MIDADNKAYLDSAKSWESDQVMRSRKSERLAWRVAAAGVVVGLAGIVAAASAWPLTKVEPFVIRVDKNTGFTDIITRVDSQSMEPNEAIDKFWLSEYVNAREEYSNALGFANYNKVGLMSTPAEGMKYYERFKPENPKSPLNTYGRDGTIEVKITSISFIEPGVASVRFERHDKNKGNESESRWIATISYAYENPPLDEQERLINPLGFQVVDYRIDAETVSAPAIAGVQ